MTRTDVQLAEIGPDDDLFPAWCEVLAAGQRADRPDEPPRPAGDHVALGRQLVSPGGSRDGTHRAALVDGAVVGALRLLLPLKDKLTVALVDVAVHPERRRRGLGSMLVADGIRLACAAGRTDLIAEIDEPRPDGAGRAFAVRHSWTCDLVETGVTSCCHTTRSRCRRWRPRPGARPWATRSGPGGTGRRTSSSPTGPCWSSG